MAAMSETKIRIIVVDDDARLRELLNRYLSEQGFNVRAVADGNDMNRWLARERYDLIVLDLMMPEVSGFVVARALRDSEQTARIPILVLTAKDLTAEDRARLNGDVSAIREKASFSTSELLAELRRALPKSAGG
jgi:DNA-binding response OmpR family regulator